MNTVVDFPTIELDATPSFAIATMTDAALAPLTRIEGDLRALAERYRAVAFDLKTPKGLADAKAARHDLRENGRYAVQRATDAFKKQANEAKRAVEAKAEQLIAITKPREDEIDGQIRAREEEVEREREAKRQAEAARIAGHEQALSAIGAFLAATQRADMTAARIDVGIASLEAVVIDPDQWEEFLDRAVALREQTLAGMREQRDRLAAREAEAARLEAQRKENERIAAELAEQQRKLNEQAAELRRQQHECEAARQRAERPAPAATAAIMGSGDTPAPGQRETPQITHQDAQESGCSPADAPAAGTPASYASSAAESATAAPSGEQGPGAQADISAPEPATLKLGEVNARLGFTMTREFVENTLGVIPAGTDKRAVLFRPSQFAAICGALVSHVQAMSPLYEGAR